MADILVVDDDQSIATAFERFLKHEGHDYRLASNAEDAVRLIGERAPDLVLMDVRMPGVDGLQALQTIRSRFPDVYVVIMTAYGTSQTSIDAIRAGAFDYLTKPLDLDRLRVVIRQALGAQRIRDAAEEPEAATSVHAHVRLVGDSPAMHEVYKMIGTLATTDVPALIVGERGTGKALVAATIHDNSGRSQHAFIALDCATLPDADLESDLFGPQPGTVHLASVDKLPPSLQARLARALSADRLRGAAGVEARILASTDADLAAGVESGLFSRELHDALTVITLRLPPLRDRRDDIPSLVRHFVQRFNERLSRTIKGVDEQVSRRLQDHAWPGNVGELERVIKRACIVTRSDVIADEDLGGNLADTRAPGRDTAEAAMLRAARTVLQERLVEPSGPSPSPFHEIVDLVEAALVGEALAITNGNQVKAAEILGVNRATLRKKMTTDG